MSRSDPNCLTPIVYSQLFSDAGQAREEEISHCEPCLIGGGKNTVDMINQLFIPVVYDVMRGHKSFSPTRYQSLHRSRLNDIKKDLISKALQ